MAKRLLALIPMRSVPLDLTTRFHWPIFQQMADETL
jgi:hypothetical protein